ncbi:ribose-phosphate pyrophosphokinase [Cribrihabitans marinus]|uniref:Ribose-phosphate pyrophosphokinase n=1 Tax=Cribrihabitans marinus TaxID=1227549 RepID=A0A1H6QPM3_9RHOB|nr:ribose-phosphate diphosphokinase [Cribrihabitans marinus]GGH18422.1 phosphoribosylpyrophosphate synthetase [Cribrihabitans marinus]SEI40962.1 ribose-phosphate pyrophosphokinase [Cribrihabitans marinus]
MILVTFPEMRPLAEDLAPAIGADLRELDWHRFPDGESLISLPGKLDGADVALLATLRDPDRLALPLRFAAATAREMGARRVGLIAPYLGYMRQDRRFEAGQAVSAPLFAQFLGQSFDWLVTVDPHLHRIARLDDVFPIPAMRAVSAPLLASWIETNLPDAVLLGPDSESQQWVAEVARLAGRPHEVLRKVRSGDRSVDVSVPESAALQSGTPVILDDIASSGTTMARAVERLLDAGTPAPVCLVIHAVFADGAHDAILSAGAARVVSTDTIPHSTNAIGIAGVLTDALRSLAAGLDLPAAGTPRLAPNPAERTSE